MNKKEKNSIMLNGLVDIYKQYPLLEVNSTSNKVDLFKSEADSVSF